MKTILLATSNPHKLEEIQAVFDQSTVQLTTLGAIGLNIEEPVEDQDTFEGNALLKAQYYANASNHSCIADDSGLEVDALNGEPGVHSARYSGTAGPRDMVDPANNAKLLQALGDLPADQRTARFVCVMALCEPDTTEPICVVRGTIEGRILGPGDPDYAIDNPTGRGSNGFGYDPLFLVPSLGKTTAEISPQEKNNISHRGQAARLMWQKVQSRFSQ